MMKDRQTSDLTVNRVYSIANIVTLKIYSEKPGCFYIDSLLLHNNRLFNISQPKQILSCRPNVSNHCRRLEREIGSSKHCLSCPSPT